MLAARSALNCGWLAAIALFTAGGAIAALRLQEQGRTPRAKTLIQAAPLLGVNLAGGETSSKTMPGRIGYNYKYPTGADADLAYSTGVRLFRIPLREDRAQEGFFGPLRPEVATLIYPIIDHILAKPGTIVLIDWHSFGKRHGVPYGSEPWGTSAIVDLNAKFLSRYRGQGSRVWLGLQNEPKGAGDQWWPVAQRVVLALRKKGIANTIVVAGAGYSAAKHWKSTNGPAATAFIDPENRIVFEAHSYFDADGSGTNPGCKPGTEERLLPAIRHAEANGYRLLFGELAVGTGPQCDAVRRAAIQILRSSDKVVGAAWWAMGDFHQFPKYPFGLTGPQKGQPSPLLKSLVADWPKRHLERRQ